MSFKSPKITACLNPGALPPITWQRRFPKPEPGPPVHDRVELRGCFNIIPSPAEADSKQQKTHHFRHHNRSSQTAHVLSSNKTFSTRDRPVVAQNYLEMVPEPLLSSSREARGGYGYGIQFSSPALSAAARPSSILCPSLVHLPESCRSSHVPAEEVFVRVAHASLLIYRSSPDHPFPVPHHDRRLSTIRQTGDWGCAGG